MTRLTFGLYRKGVRQPGYTLSAAATEPGYPTPMPTAIAAISRYHRQGASASLAHIRASYNSSSYWGPSGSPQAFGWANAMIAAFERYVTLAEHDPRPAFATALDRAVVFGAHEVAVHVDVVLLDEDGYVARIVAWDSSPIGAGEATLYATPVLLAVEEELGEGRVVGVEVWHLRSGSQFFITAEQCNAAIGAVERVVDRVAR